jgi:hypothetical protein
MAVFTAVLQSQLPYGVGWGETCPAAAQLGGTESLDLGTQGGGCHCTVSPAVLTAS